MIKHYYFCRFTQKSPLRISNGDNEETDSDLMRDSRGLPYIPGTALAGVMRSLLPEDEAKELFGYLTVGSKEIRESRVLVSDAVLPAGTKVHATSRDSVALDSEGVAKDTAKFDFEVVECGVPYQAVLEIDGDDSLMLKVIAVIRREGGIAFGGRTTRGYGHMAAEFRRKSFDPDKPAELQSWLDYDPYTAGAFDKAESFGTDAVESGAAAVRVCAELAMKGSFIVRVYKESDTNAVPMQDRNGNAVIPGTTWAGIFRHHMSELAEQVGIPQEKIDGLFGYAGESRGSAAQKSRITFSESRVSGGKDFDYRRTALDRFTMAPKDGALYTETLCYGGRTELELLIPGDMEPLMRDLLAASLRDLHCGLLYFGGEGGIGRGMAEITGLTVNGENRTDALASGLDFLGRGE